MLASANASEACEQLNGRAVCHPTERGTWHRFTQIALRDGRVPERPNGTVSKTVVGVCLPWVQIPPLPPLSMTSFRPTDSEIRDGRGELTRRYLAALRALGDLPLRGERLRDRLRVGAIDWWLASETRESSLWRDPSIGEQVAALTRASRDSYPAIPMPSAQIGRALLSWARSLFHSLRIPDSADLQADVVFVDYWTASSAGSSTKSSGVGASSRWTSAYFSDLPDLLRASGVSIAHLHIHSDGPITKAPVVARRAVSELDTVGPRHLLVAGVLSPGLVARALVKWLRLQARSLRLFKVLEDSVADDDLRRLLPWWRGKLVASLRGGHSVRVAVLSELFGRVVSANPNTKVWVVAFEGQSWEACISRQLEHHDARWIPYLHTMMRPWDLRARTFIGEAPLLMIAVHGEHDSTELSGLGASLVEVEALRYQHFASRSTSATLSTDTATTELNTSSHPTWLIVGGADCIASHLELTTLVSTMARLGIVRRLLVRWHPQCEIPSEMSSDYLVFTTESLSDLTTRVRVAYMVGSAAPLDTYLSGIPSCSLRAASGLDMSPIAEGPGHHIAETTEELIGWMVKSEAMSSFSPPIQYFFVIDPELPRWRSQIQAML